MNIDSIFADIRQSIEDCGISWGEIAFLQAHRYDIPEDDYTLIEWGAMPEDYD